MTLYQVPSLDPELTVSVGWDAELVSYVAQVEGVPAPGALHDPDRPLVAWFGSRRGELGTVDDLQDAIRGYAVLRPDIRAALEADRAGRADRATPAVMASAPLRLVASDSGPDEAPRAARDPFLGRALLDLALMVAAAVVAVILVLAAAIAAIANL